MKKKNILIALTMIASLCLLYWGIEFLKGVNMFKPANFYYASFEQVEGLVEAAPVTVNGFPVGQVREISYDYGSNSISVMMAMNRDLRIPVGSHVELSKSLTGASSLELTLAQGTTDYYKVGDKVPTQHTPGLIDKVTDDVLPQVAGLMPKVDSIVGGVNALVSSPELRMSLARLDAITQQLEASSRQLTQIMQSLNRSVPGVMSDVNGITGQLGETSGNLNALSGTLRALPLDSTMMQVNATLANLQAVSQRLNDPESSLGRLMSDRELYDNANRAIADLDSLFVDIKKNPKRYVTIKVF